MGGRTTVVREQIARERTAREPAAREPAAREPAARERTARDGRTRERTSADGRPDRRPDSRAGDRRRGRSPAVPAGRAEQRAARRAVKRERLAALTPVHRRRRRAALLVGALVVLAGLAVGVRLVVFDLGVFDVDQVRVSGAVDTPVPAVEEAAAVPLGEPLAGVDIAAVAQQVAQLATVRSVAVTRTWPHAVSIAITERTPVAVVQTQQGLVPVDSDGVAYAATAPTGLPQLTFGNIRPDDPSTAAAITVLAALPPAVRDQVQTVDVSTAGGTAQVTLGLTEARQVRWGDSEDSEEKASVTVALLTQEGHVYDVSSPELPTIRS